MTAQERKRLKALINNLEAVRNTQVGSSVQQMTNVKRSPRAQLTEIIDNLKAMVNDDG